jgi:hypothetical protein
MHARHVADGCMCLRRWASPSQYHPRLVRPHSSPKTVASLRAAAQSKLVGHSKSKRRESAGSTSSRFCRLPQPLPAPFLLDLDLGLRRVCIADVFVRSRVCTLLPNACCERMHLWMGGWVGGCVRAVCACMRVCVCVRARACMFACCVQAVASSGTGEWGVSGGDCDQQRLRYSRDKGLACAPESAMRQCVFCNGV